MSPKTGRPPLDDARQQKVETRMNKKELEKLDYCCQATNMARSEVIRLGIDKVYAELEKSSEK